MFFFGKHTDTRPTLLLVFKEGLDASNSGELQWFLSGTGQRHSQHTFADGLLNGECALQLVLLVTLLFLLRLRGRGRQGGGGRGGGGAKGVKEGNQGQGAYEHGWCFCHLFCYYYQKTTYQTLWEHFGFGVCWGSMRELVWIWCFYAFFLEIVFYWPVIFISFKDNNTKK